jgi:hypothetical protein
VQAALFPFCSHWYDFSTMLNQIELSRVDLKLLVLFETVLAKGNIVRSATGLAAYAG